MSLRARSNGGGTVRNGGGRGNGNGSPGGRGNNGSSGNSQFLLHLDGTNGANGPYTDSSSYGRTFTNSYGAQISLQSLQKVFGTTSCQMTSGSGLTTPNATELQVGSGDWTAEWRYFRNGAHGGANAGFVGKTGASGNFEWYFSFNSTSGINQWEWAYSTNGTSWNLQQTAGTWAASTWFAFALVRSGSTMNFYQNGTRIWQPTVSGTIRAGTGSFWVGDPMVLAGFNGSNRYFDEVRFTKGTALYTGASYTVDTSPFTG